MKDQLVVEQRAPDAWSPVPGHVAARLERLINDGNAVLPSLTKVLEGVPHTTLVPWFAIATSQTPDWIAHRYGVCGTSAYKAMLFRARYGRKLLGFGTLVIGDRRDLSLAETLPALADALTDRTRCAALATSPRQRGVVIVPADGSLALGSPEYQAALTDIVTALADSGFSRPGRRSGVTRHIGGYLRVRATMDAQHVEALASLAGGRVAVLWDHPIA
jgi:hypothetical protein